MLGSWNLHSKGKKEQLQLPPCKVTSLRLTLTRPISLARLTSTFGNPNIYLVYEFNQWTPDFGNKHPFHNCLFGSTDTSYNGRGIAFDSYGTWTHANGKTARNALIFGTGTSKSIFDHNILIKSQESNILLLNRM